MKMKKGIFFSTDALLALSIVLVLLLVVTPFFAYPRVASEVSSDLISTFSVIKVGEFDNAYVKGLISSGVINDTDNSLIQQLGELYVKDRVIAQNFANEMLKDIDVHQNIGIWMTDPSNPSGGEMIASKNLSSWENAENREVSRQQLSGVQAVIEGKNLTGYSARATFSSSVRTKYFYFGGYVGDGNITVRSDYNGTIISAMVEAVFSNNFSVYVNGQHAGDYGQSNSSYAPSVYQIDISDFNSGPNNDSFISEEGTLAITGGFLKIGYESEVEYTQPTRQYLPGITGIINVYDGLHLNGQLINMNIYLHYNNSFRTLLIIGNTTVFNESLTGEQKINIGNTALAANLSYNYISNKTSPLRLTLGELNIIGEGGIADVVLITDKSGSMDWRMNQDGVSGTDYACDNPLLYSDGNTRRLTLAKCINKDFIGTILRVSGNRVGLVSFSANGQNDTSLISDSTVLNNTVDSYTSTGGTCLPCAINAAHDLLENQSNKITRKQFVIVMSDGVANYRAADMCYNTNSISTNETQSIFAGVSGSTFSYNDNYLSPLINRTSTNINDIDLYNSTFGYAVGLSYQFFSFNGTNLSYYQDLGSDSMNGISLYNSTFGFAVGDSGKIARLQGTAWSEFVDLGNNNIYDLDLYNSTFGFAVGSSGKIYNFSGNAWSEFVDLNNENINGISLYNSTFGFAVGSSGRIYNFNGNAWSLLIDLGNMVFTEVHIYNGTRAFAVGDDSVIYNWSGGTSWTVSYSTTDPSVNYLNSVRMVNGTLGFAAGHSSNGILIWNGNSWSKIMPSFFYQTNKTRGISCSDYDGCDASITIPMLNSNYSSCRIKSEMPNATVHSVGFGLITSCSFANITLKSVAQCGNGSFMASNNASALQEFYQNIALDILNVSYLAQAASIVGSVHGVLYPDSYIEFNISSRNIPYGLVVPLEQKFTNTTNAYFNISSNATLVESKAVSYSGSRWTSIINLNNRTIYNLSMYGSKYSYLGDPYAVNLPIGLINYSNSVGLMTGLAPPSIFEGSASNKVITTVILNYSSYKSYLTTRAEGCKWKIEFEDGHNETISIPPSYTGTSQCRYDSEIKTYDAQDAYQVAIYRLLKDIDFDGNGMADISFGSSDLNISTSVVSGIPFSWSSEFQVRAW